MKKKVFFISGTVVVFALLFMFASCSSDDDFIVDNNLDINSQIPLTRGGFDINPGPNDFRWDQDECCLIALVKKKKQQMPGHRFTEQYPMSKCYEDLKTEAVKMDKKNHPNDHYNGEGPMPTDLFETLGVSEGILTGQASDSLLNDPKEQNLIVKINIHDEKTNTDQKHVGRVVGRTYKKDENDPDKEVVDEIKVEYGDARPIKVKAKDILTVWN